MDTQHMGDGPNLVRGGPPRGSGASVKRRILGLAALLCLFADLVGCIQPTLRTIPATPQIRALEQEMFERVNETRRLNKLPLFVYDESLADIARSHSLDMRDHDFFAHESPSTGTIDDRLRISRYDFVTARENLAYDVDIPDAHKHLMGSPGHRENLLSQDVTHIGVGVVKQTRAGYQDAIFVTEVFSAPYTPMTASQADDAITDLFHARRSDLRLGKLVRDPILDEVLDDLIGDVGGDIGDATLQRLGTTMMKRLQDARFQTSGLDLIAQQFTTTERFVQPDDLNDANTQSFGLATRARTDHGTKIVLVLIAFSMR